MNKAEVILLEVFYHLTNKNTFLLPIIRYLDVIVEITGLSIDGIMDIYNSLLENGYIKNIREDKFIITSKGLEALGFKALRNLVAKNINTITLSQLS